MTSAAADPSRASPRQVGSFGPLQRWRPAKGDVNKIKMEVSATGRYVRYADHLAELERLKAENERLSGILRAVGERTAAIAAFGAAAVENMNKVAA